VVEQKNIKSKTSITDRDKITAAYLRVSTKTQIEEGASIEVQRNLAHNYAEKHNLSLRNEYIFEESKPVSVINGERFDIEESIHKRPILNELLSLATQGMFKNLIVYSRDRLTRNVKEYFALKHMLSAYGVRVHFSKSSENLQIGSKENTDSNASENSIQETTGESYIEKLIEVVLASIAELESNMISSRTRLGNKQCAVEKLWTGGKVPFGNRAQTVHRHGRKRKNSVLTPIPYEQAIIQQIFEYYGNYGYGYRKIADKMNQEYPFKTWRKSTIESILKNEVYTGHIVWGRRGGRRNPGKREEYTISDKINDMEIICDTLWYKTHDLRDKKSKIQDPAYFSSPFLLKTKLYCGVCNQQMSGKNYGTNKQSVYRCSKRNDANKSEQIIEKSKLEREFINKLSSLLTVDNVDELWGLYYTEQQQEKSLIKNVTLDLSVAITQLDQQVTEIRDALNLKIDYSIKLELRQLETYIQEKLDYYNIQLDAEETKLNRFYDSKVHFQSALSKFIDNFDQLEIRNKRLIIDLLVDKVTVTSNKNTIDVDIILNPPHRIF
jgi:DNA invertase Pin-like site-specific DNA recombinase